MFCTKGLAVVKSVLHHITDLLEQVVEEVTKYTQLIKDLEASASVEAIVAIIPKGSQIEGWLNTALDEINGVANTAETFSVKLEAWLATFPTDLAKDGGVFKLASRAIKAGDTEQNATKTESFYDSITQLHIMSNK